jgi:hypothetical protein
MLAYSFPLLGVFISLFFLFLWVVWFLLLFRVVTDIFRSPDLGGFAKAAWTLLVIVLPYLGVFVYLVARGAGMTQRDLDTMRANEAAVHEYIRSAAGNAVSTADELAKLADLQARGVISDAEFQASKAKLLA